MSRRGTTDASNKGHPGNYGQLLSLGSVVQCNVSDKHSKKRVKYHVKSLREIRRAQKYVGLLIPRLPFMRVVKQSSANLCSLMKASSFINVRWQTQALLCLQEAAEDFAIDFMNDAYLCAAHAHRVTLMAKDYVIVSRIRYKFDKSLEVYFKYTSSSSTQNNSCH
ncbi:hypothetical protein KP509_11G067300 [Ceratopteris richardii]|uniref:Core Histone H2A/H2B/H3 domain-containing protein n=1 Tax=Ceratopteris richardii TaxID=49495 RepID=A0A8T2TTH0_CERRI|nr:hypothetical protein KP509_11G067300 [Ceratopteris richardii]